MEIRGNMVRLPQITNDYKLKMQESYRYLKKELGLLLHPLVQFAVGIRLIFICFFRRFVQLFPGASWHGELTDRSAMIIYKNKKSDLKP